MNGVFQDYYSSFLGIIQITVIHESITSLAFVDHIGSSVSHPIIEECKKQLEAYFSKQLTTFHLPINPTGTAFQQKVWKTLETLHYGEVLSYRDLAIQMGRPSSVRAIANAISKNPVLILIPCHRVIGKNGSLTGYSGGIYRKRLLLELEKEH